MDTVLWDRLDKVVAIRINILLVVYHEINDFHLVFFFSKLIPLVL